MISKNLLIELTILFTSCLIFLLVLSLSSYYELYGDYKGFILGGKALLNDPSQLYILEFQRGLNATISSDPNLHFLPFRSFPFASLPYLLYLPFGYSLGYKVFLVSNLIFYYLFLKYFFRDHPERVAKALLLSLLFPFFIGSILIGQIVFYLLLIFFIIYRLYKAEKGFQIGLLSALFLVKLQFLPLVVGLIAISNQKIKQGLGLFIGGVLMIVGNFFLLGVDIKQYINFVSTTETYELGSRLEEMASVQLFFFNNTGLTLLQSNIVSLFIYAAFFFGFWYISRNRAPDNNFFILATLAFSVFGLHINGNEFMIFTVPLLIAFLYPNENKIKYLNIFLFIIFYPIFRMFRTESALPILIFVLLNIYFIEIAPRLKRKRDEI